MSVKHADEVPYAPVSAGQDTSIQILISPEEGPHFAMRRFTMKPGGGMPLHTNAVEHEQYVLQGQAHVVIGETTYEVKAGDVVLIPAGVPHSYQNIGAEDFVFLCLVPNEPDTIEILAS